MLLRETWRRAVGSGGRLAALQHKSMNGAPKACCALSGMRGALRGSARKHQLKELDPRGIATASGSESLPRRR